MHVKIVATEVHIRVVIIRVLTIDAIPIIVAHRVTIALVKLLVAPWYNNHAILMFDKLKRISLIIERLLLRRILARS